MTLKRLVLLPLQVLLAILVIIDELARPIYGPLIRRFAALRLVEMGERAVAGLPRFVILILLAVPMAVAEPLKIYSLLLLGQGRLVQGLLVLAVAYLASFLLIERIYVAGKPKLMTIGWFAWLMNLIDWVRRTLLDWLKRTPVWAMVTAARSFAARVVTVFRNAVSQRRGESSRHPSETDSR
ncbi:hypothetical protein FZC33_13220 [Labrys sp. KNU-23]|uniref:hypothetical protein n=1 Tax=Labrys sp. KNU-23 TaxID=2789216 RepID=UPI0011EE1C62|nr:hypothetical protein [Labrys sp. KNU-23]QEN87230.1 hypothetical protein FZC33_13220 [Labrys sp. KNU-23]